MIAMEAAKNHDEAETTVRKAQETRDAISAHLVEAGTARRIAEQTREEAAKHLEEAYKAKEKAENILKAKREACERIASERLRYEKKVAVIVSSGGRADERKSLRLEKDFAIATKHQAEAEMALHTAENELYVKAEQQTKAEVEWRYATKEFLTTDQRLSQAQNALTEAIRELKNRAERKLVAEEALRDAEEDLKTLMKNSERSGGN